jgi:RNA polymerase sigma factor (sigma-70 family)
VVCGCAITRSTFPGPSGTLASLHTQRMLLVENRALLDAFRRGEPQALEAVFSHYAPRVAAWVTRGFNYKTKAGVRSFSGLRSAADIHDAIHETFRAAFEERARDSYSGLAAYEGYLFAITKNVILKKLGARDVAITTDAELAELPSKDPSPEELVACEEEKKIVRDFLAGVSEEERSFIDLRFTEQLSQNAVAEKLGWGRKKVRIVEESIRRSLTRFLKRARGSAEVKEVLHDDAR